MFELMKCDEKGRKDKKCPRNDEQKRIPTYVNIFSLLIKQFSQIEKIKGDIYASH